MGVDGVCKKLFSGSALAFQQYRRVRGCGFSNFIKELGKLRIFSDDVAEIEFFKKLFAEFKILLGQPFVLNGLFDCQDQLIFGEGFG